MPLPPKCLELNKLVAQEWAYTLLQKPAHEWCIVDTETTGLGTHDEVVEIGVVDGDGEVLMDQRVCPTVVISKPAANTHGILNYMVAKEPAFFEVLPILQQCWEARTVIMYNRSFDMRMLEQSASAWGAVLKQYHVQVECAMEMYAMYNGVWNDQYGSYKWVKLGHGGTHGAVEDCQATLRALREMAGYAS